MRNKYQILRSTRNAGQYDAGQIASLRAAKSIVRAERAGRKTYWQTEGDEVCAYAAREDMTDVDKAVARLRPVGVA